MHLHSICCLYIAPVEVSGVSMPGILIGYVYSARVDTAFRLGQGLISVPFYIDVKDLIILPIYT